MKTFSAEHRPGWRGRKASYKGVCCSPRHHLSSGCLAARLASPTRLNFDVQQFDHWKQPREKQTPRRESVR